MEHALRGGVEMPDELREQGVTIPETERRGITLRQLDLFGAFIQSVLLAVSLNDSSEYSATCGERIVWAMINMYHINEHFVKPLTGHCGERGCSFVELIATTAQDPVWFVRYVSRCHHCIITVQSLRQSLLGCRVDDDTAQAEVPRQDTRAG